MEEKNDSVERVRKIIQASQLPITLRSLEITAATATLAAEALSVSVAQIAKSIVVGNSQRQFIVLLRGSERVDLELISQRFNEKFKLLDREEVLRRTGFAVGGVSPIGSLEQVAVLMDEGLYQFDIIWAAAGSPYEIFGCAPDTLQTLTKATVCHVAK